MDSKPWILEPEGPLGLSFMAMGDIGVIGSARKRALQEGFDAVLGALEADIKTAEFGFANLEFSVGRPDLVLPGRSPEFWHNAEICGALARSGIRVVSLANSHIMDCGPAGLDLTLEACRNAGIQTAGAGADLDAARRPARLKIGGQRIVVLAYAQNVSDAARRDRAGIAPLDESILCEDLRHWREEADLLIVSAHWGSMYVDYPPQRVIKMARLMAEEGTDIILGHHPHVLQGMERIGRTLVLYSMGDMVFDARAGDLVAKAASDKRRESALFMITCARVPGVSATPVLLDADGIPGIAEGPQMENQDQRLRAISDGLSKPSAEREQEAASTLLRYELDGLGQLLRHGRIDRVARLLLSVRPRHLPTLWRGLRGRRNP